MRGLHSLGYSERYACAIVDLPRSTYQDIKYRLPSNRDLRQLGLEGLVKDIHERSRATYGVLRIRAALEIEHGLVVNTKLIRKVMNRLGIKGIPGPRRGHSNLKNVATCEDLLERNFSATQPNEVWLTDITEHPTREGKLYCCGVLDMYSRKIVGWAIGRRCTSDLVNTALMNASGRLDHQGYTVIHSDHGSQFTSWAFSEKVRQLGLLSSMGTIGDAYDNAPMESFWGSMQVELLNRQPWHTFVELSTAIADYIENFYNTNRRHSSIGYLTPQEFEEIHTGREQAQLLQTVAH